MAKVTSAKDVTVIKHQIPAYGLTPNTSIQRKPLFIYKSAFQQSITASEVEAHLRKIGVVTPQWRYTMYSTSHFHSTSHEVLCISRGNAKLCFGHEGNADKVVATVGKGDVIVVPAGVAHRLLEDLSDGEGFEMVGSYPEGCEWDMCYGTESEKDRVESIKDVKWFGRDPIYGDEGPVLNV